MAQIFVPLAAVVIAGCPVHSRSEAFLVGNAIQVVSVGLGHVILVVTAIVVTRFKERAQLWTRFHVLILCIKSTPPHLQNQLRTITRTATCSLGDAGRAGHHRHCIVN